MAINLLTFKEERGKIPHLIMQLVTTEEQLEQWVGVWGLESAEEVHLWLTSFLFCHTLVVFNKNGSDVWKLKSFLQENVNHFIP